MKKKEEGVDQFSLLNLEDLHYDSNKSKNIGLESKTKKKRKIDLPEITIKDIIDLIYEGYSIKTLRFVSRVENDIGKDLCGMCCFETKEILLNSNYNFEPEKRDSIIHELCHSIVCKNLGEESLEDEDIQRLSRNIYNRIYKK